jgi:hypothetical protein
VRSRRSREAIRTLRPVPVRFGSQVIAHDDMKRVIQQACALQVGQARGGRGEKGKEGIETGMCSV